MLEPIGRSAGCPRVRGQCVNAKSDQRAQGNRKRPSGSGSQRQADKRALIPKKLGVTGSPHHHPRNRKPGSPSTPTRPRPQPATAPQPAPDFLADATTPRGTAADNTIRSDVLAPGATGGRGSACRCGTCSLADADAYFGKVLRKRSKGTRLARSQALRTYFLFVEIRHKVAIHQMTGRVAECPVDEMNRPRGAGAGRRCGSRRRRVQVGRAVRRVAGGAGDLPEVRAWLPAAMRRPG